MPITLNITQETPNEIVNAIMLFAGQFKQQGAEAQPITVTVPVNVPGESKADLQPAAEPVTEKKTRKKAPAAQEILDQTVVLQPANDGAPMLTIEDARERLRGLMAQKTEDGKVSGTDALSAALAKRNIKKMTEVDPDAGGKPSAKYAELVTEVEDRMAGKV